MTAEPGVDVQRCGEVIKCAGEEVGRELCGLAYRRQRGDVELVVAVMRVEVRHGGGALHVEHVVTRAQIDVEGLDAGVFNTHGHAESAQAGGGECADAVGGVGSVVGVDDVSASLAVQGEQCADSVHHTVDGRGGAADVESFVADAAIDGGGAGDGLDEEGVITRTSINYRDSGDGGLDGERVVAGTERDVQRAKARVGDDHWGRAAHWDAGTHAESGDGRGGEDAGLVRGTAGIIQVHRVISAAVDDEWETDLVQHTTSERSEAADVHGVRAEAKIDGGDIADGADVDGVTVGTRVHGGGGPGEGADDGEGVALVVERDSQRFHAGVGHGAGHAQSAQRAGGQRSGLAGGTGGINDDHRVIAAAGEVKVAQNVIERVGAADGDGVDAASEVEVRRGGAYPGDVDGVAPVGQDDVEGVEPAVGDAAAAESESCERAGGDGAGSAQRGGGVVEVGDGVGIAGDADGRLDVAEVAVAVGGGNPRGGIHRHVETEIDAVVAAG